MPLRRFVVTFPAADTSAICASQTLGAAGALQINGTSLYKPDTMVGIRRAFFVLPSTSVTQTPGSLAQAVVTLSSTANYGSTNITITGKSVTGAAVTETRAGPNNNTVATTAEFAEVDSITSNGALATAITVGWGTTGTTAWYQCDQYISQANVTVALAITATASVTVQNTPDDVNTVSSPVTFNHPVLAAQTSSAESNYAFPPNAIRAVLNSSSGSGAFTMTIIQAGL